jgi:hypothetical protein
MTKIYTGQQATLVKVINLLNRLEELTNDSELGDYFNHAVLLLESANDRITQIEEEVEAEGDDINLEMLDLL